MKVCRFCSTGKDISEFYTHPNGHQGRDSKCKVCKRLYQKKYRESNHLSVKVANKKWADANPSKMREIRRREKAKSKDREHASHIKRKYGLSRSEYDSMLASQGGKCAANGCLETAHNGRLSVDHDHSTGAVRGLLCNGCNTALGRVSDSIEKLNGLIAYLERNRT